MEPKFGISLKELRALMEFRGVNAVDKVILDSC